MEEVARARFADELATGAQEIREVAAVPARPARVVPIEVADLLPGRAGDRRVAAQVRVEGGRAGFLRAEDQKVRKRAELRGGSAVGPDRIAQDRPGRLRDRRDQLGGEPGHRYLVAELAQERARFGLDVGDLLLGQVAAPAADGPGMDSPEPLRD